MVVNVLLLSRKESMVLLGRLFDRALDFIGDNFGEVDANTFRALTIIGLICAPRVQQYRGDYLIRSSKLLEIVYFARILVHQMKEKTQG